ncbi:Dephospho-CoA kinase [Peptoniphilus harei]|uniref:dephospho-CoA kinase n=1 Tax=Peptoniphilus harei TaxID=54005 RepID=UPI000F6BC7C3|nr:dephospho-CoA kinase [Peptoniphilus harei]MDU1642442.1 dephospho-CoA kinase [Peptoniphilus harei]QQE47099.1 dephospho-CoA kinase [Peptoniphilus harei]VEJ34556.1 Dephospho-CoA kinase [Peptoniphilus harei]
MSQNKIIGLTGSISTGKTQVSNYLRNRGEKVIDADLIAREVVDLEPVKEKIKEVFGDDIYKDDELDRKALGEIVFRDKEKRQVLNEIEHPEIYRIILEEIKNSKGRVFVDIPLLFESQHLNEKYGLVFDEVWLVYVNRETQVKRLIKRDRISRGYALEKINSQMSVEDKKIMADVIIDNSGSLEETFKQVEENLKRL